MQVFRFVLCVFLAVLLGMLWGIWSYSFSLYMHAEDLGVLSSPELMDLVTGAPPQITSQVIAALVGGGICLALLVGSFVPRPAGRRTN